LEEALLGKLSARIWTGGGSDRGFGGLYPSLPGRARKENKDTPISVYMETGGEDSPCKERTAGSLKKVGRNPRPIVSGEGNVA